jgi:hypothetical protein
MGSMPMATIKIFCKSQAQSAKRNKETINEKIPHFPASYTVLPRVRERHFKCGSTR